MTVGQPVGPTVARTLVLDWLAGMGARWGMPEESCRIHGWLYLASTTQTVEQMCASTGIREEGVRASLDWLRDHQIAQECPLGQWSTGADPWELVARALEVRRQRELGPALEVLKTGVHESASDPRLLQRIGKLLALVEDIAAIDAQAQRFAPGTMRRMIGVTGRAARFIDRMAGYSRTTEK